MLPIAGQAAGPHGLNFFVDTKGWVKKISNIFFQIFFFYWQRWALQLVLNNTESLNFMKSKLAAVKITR